MRRASPLLVVPLLLLPMLLASVIPAAADEARPASPAVAGSDEIQRIDRRIRTAEHRVQNWYGRLDRWHRRISRAAAEVDRFEREAEASIPVTLDGTTGWFPMRDLPSHRLERAQERLRSILVERSAVRAQRQMDAWSAVLTELRRERERLLYVEPAPERPRRPDRGEPDLSYEGWARAFLERVGAPSCGENLLIVVTWETSEGTDAAFNPLATTRVVEGAAGDFNAVGVKDYVSLDQGLDASRDTLQEGAASYGYEAILSALRDCAPAEATAAAINASAWCRGCAGGAYLTGLLPIVRGNYATYAVRMISAGSA